METSIEPILHKKLFQELTVDELYELLRVRSEVLEPSLAYETSMALVTFSFGSVFGIVMVRMPSSTLAEIWSFTTSSGSTNE